MSEFCPQECEYLNFSELEQEYVRALTRRTPPHWCEKYDMRLWHFSAHPNLYKCEECIKNEV